LNHLGDGETRGRTPIEGKAASQGQMFRRKPSLKKFGLSGGVITDITRILRALVNLKGCRGKGPLIYDGVGDSERVKDSTKRSISLGAGGTTTLPLDRNHRGWKHFRGTLLCTKGQKRITRVIGVPGIHRGRKTYILTGWGGEGFFTGLVGRLSARGGIGRGGSDRHGATVVAFLASKILSNTQGVFKKRKRKKRKLRKAKGNLSCE